jgi:hypothetical protein
MNYENEMSKSVTPVYLMFDNQIINNFNVSKTDRNCNKLQKNEEILPSPHRRRTQDEVARYGQGTRPHPLPLLQGEGEKTCLFNQIKC